MKDKKLNDLLAFFKALSDANRLKIIGLLANQSYTVEQLAAMLELSPSTISHHLSKLGNLDLVTAQADGYYNMYELNTRKLEEMSKDILSRETLTSFTTDIDLEAFDRKVLKDFLTPDGVIRQLPAQEKKFISILKYLIEKFEPDREYPEKEVNEIIEQYYEDYASLRRGFIEYKFMVRDSGIYKRLTS